MRLSPSRRPCHGGFTLVELLVVVTIIALLVALLSSAVFKVLALGKVTTNKTDIDQLSTAIVNFTTTNKVPYFPSRIHLSENCNYDLSTNPATGLPNNQLDTDSVAYLSRLWPRANFQPQPPGGPIWYDWNGDGGRATDPQQGEFILEGDQCLVFFLGGIPLFGGSPGTTGFSAVPSDPTFHSKNAAKPGNVNPPLFEFDSSRLVALVHQSQLNNTQPSGFYSYLDVYKKQPYGYFSNYGKINGYNRFFSQATVITIPGSAPVTVLQAGVSDCASLPVQSPTGQQGVGLWPFAESPRTPASPFPDLKYLKPDGFQIISAGADKQFGPGTNPTAGPGGSPLFWTAATADNYTGAGSDDQANFYALTLGSGS